MYKLLLLNMLLCVTLVEAKITKINNSSLLASSELGEINLYHSPGKFFIKQNGEFHAIESYNTDALLKQLKTEHLDKFQQVAFFSLSQLSDCEFVLRGHIRGNGGGPFAAAIGAWLARAALYAPPALAVGAATAASAGVGPVVAASSAGTMVGATATAMAGTYIATAEGAATAVAITLAACPFLP